MAGGTRSELASSSPEGSSFITSYPNGQRGSYGGAIMERSGSFRESLDSRVSLSGSAVARSPTHATNVDFSPLSSSLLLDPFSLGDQKYTRYGELRRVLGVSLEENPFGSLQSKPLAPIPSEELKHFKVGLQEVSTRARDRAKICHESILKVDKYRNHTRKRLRLETTFEKSIGMPRAVNQSHQNPADPILQRLEERTKNAVPNKRVRSSIAELRSEGRANSLLRQGSIMEKDKTITEREKNLLRACNGGANLIEDKPRFLSAGDCLDNKMKRKRSTGSLSTRVMDSEREVKQGMQQRVKTEPRPRPSDGVGFRPNSSMATIAVNKLDGTSQQIFGGSRALPKSDLDNSSLVNDRREQSSLFEKDRSIAKGTNKLSVREDPLSGTQNPLTKGKASRAPRTGSASIISSVRTPGGLDGWEPPHSLNKSQNLNAPNNRKRSLSTGPSSLHVTNWVGQRPQKIRMRRTNLVSPVSGQDESQTAMTGSPASDAGVRLPTSDAGVSVLSKVTTGVSYLSNMIHENANSPAIMSESEESGAAENKYKEKGINNGEDGATHAVRKVSSLLLPMKKNRPHKEESGDGVRRLGRSGRGLPLSKQALSSVKEKLESIHTTKLVRNGRLTSDRTESKVGRPPSKKAGDRKAFSRPGHAVNSSSAELIAECEDDHEELFAAVTYARNYSNLTCPKDNLFWKTVNPYFASVDAKSLALLKRQISFAEELDGIVSIDIDHKDDIVQQIGGTFETDDWLKRVVPLSQRLLAAIIPDYDTDCKNGQQEHDLFSRFRSVNSYEARCLTDSEGKDNESMVEFEAELEMAFQSQKTGSRDNSCNGYVVPSNFRSQVSNNYPHFNGMIDGKSTMSYSESIIHSGNIQNSMESMHSVGAEYCGIPPFVFQYEHMSLEDKILLELQSIGLQPETVPDLSDGEDEQIDRDISELKMKLYQQASCIKTGLIKLDKAVQNARVLEERKLEHIAMDKLVETAYKKFQGGRGHHGNKGINKVSKQAALAFGKRTLARCYKFENSERSCFSELPLRNILFSSSPFSGNTKPKNLQSGDAIYTELQASNPSSVLAGHGIVCHGLDQTLGDPLQGPTQTSDQSFAKPETVQCRGKKREVSLGDVVGNVVLRHTSNVGNSIPGGAKGKRSERERDQSSSGRSSVAKIGRPSAGPLKGERKTKPKLKQKTAQLSTSGILLGRHTETDIMSPLVHESPEAKQHWNNKGNERTSLHHSSIVSQDERKETEETLDLSNLPLQPIDSIDELGGEVQDFDSWLNVDDEMLQDNDINGLDIPMDDLTELEMNF